MNSQRVLIITLMLVMNVDFKPLYEREIDCFNFESVFFKQPDIVNECRSLRQDQLQAT